MKKFSILAVIAALTLSACGETNYIVEGSDEYRKVMFKVKNVTCETEFKSFNKLAKIAKNGVIDSDIEQQLAVAKASYTQCQNSFLQDENIAIAD